MHTPPGNDTEIDLQLDEKKKILLPDLLIKKLLKHSSDIHVTVQ